MNRPPPTGSPTRPASPAATAWPQPSRLSPPLCSDLLLQGQRMVEIRHNGEIYRLQTTRQGKLILTK